MKGAALSRREAMSDDNIFREVDEDLRREQMTALLDKYGVYLLIGAAVIIVIVGGYNGYRWWSVKQAAENGAVYYRAAQLAQDKKPPEAIAAFSKIAAERSGGYRTLAELEIAALHAQEGRKVDAVAMYDHVAQTGADATLRDFARIQAAALRLDDADRAEMVKRLDGLNNANNPWRYSARELLALAAFRSGDTSESEKMFTQILTDGGAPAELRGRAEAMLALLVKTPGAANPAPAAKEGSVTQ
jgi:hypothetical protein